MIFVPTLNMYILILCKKFGMLCLTVYNFNIYACIQLDIFPVKCIDEESADIFNEASLGVG